MRREAVRSGAVSNFTGTAVERSNKWVVFLPLWVWLMSHDYDWMHHVMGHGVHYFRSLGMEYSELYALSLMTTTLSKQQAQRLQVREREMLVWNSALL